MGVSKKRINVKDLKKVKKEEVYLLYYFVGSKNRKGSRNGDIYGAISINSVLARKIGVEAGYEVGLATLQNGQWEVWKIGSKKGKKNRGYTLHESGTGLRFTFPVSEEMIEVGLPLIGGRKRREVTKVQVIKGAIRFVPPKLEMTLKELRKEQGRSTD